MRRQVRRAKVRWQELQEVEAVGPGVLVMGIERTSESLFESL